MKKEEAIAKLDELRDEVYNEDSDGYSYAQAIDMAIESLSAEPSKSTEQNVADVPSGDLISREEAIKVGNKIVEELSSSSIYWDDLKCWAKELFDALPSADRPKGEWLDVEHEPYCECSVCGAYIENLDDDFAFCPRCGADMK